MELLSTISPTIWYAIFGAFAIKLLELAELHKLSKVERPDLKDWLYWLPFIIMPIIGGGLAHLHVSSSSILTPLLAMNIGISAPLILRTMAQINPLDNKIIKTKQGA
ncbi:MAG: hypothetical protein ACI88H_002077 [Cocleimonas sp.]